NSWYGSIEENGCGKLNGITGPALSGIAALGVTHVWYTGVIEHAKMTDYSAYGIQNDDPDVVKGRAGSPYAIRDYYDIDPDLAEDVSARMAEFEQLVQRTHAAGMKVIIDFVPNHVARTYASDQRPETDFGSSDDHSQAFSPQNEFYYIPGHDFHVPPGYDPGGAHFSHPLKDGRFAENPAKATGNDVFSASPSINDWFETVKLNYGVDYLDHHRGHFDPPPPVWQKMKDILLFWAGKGIDGFRCDMAEMVPVEFWTWVISGVKKAHPEVLFLAEAYDNGKYERFIYEGGFDYLYDKVDLYDSLKKLMQGGGNTYELVHWAESAKRFENQMLRFLENHDEQRIASRFFAGDPWPAVPAMAVSALVSGGPVMLYAGQEFGEPASGAQGFSGDDGRTSIFDYCGVPELQKWTNNGAFDGAKLTENQRKLYGFYRELLCFCRDEAVVRDGQMYDITHFNHQNAGFSDRIWAFVRHTENARLLVVANFLPAEQWLDIRFPGDLADKLNFTTEAVFTCIFSAETHPGGPADGLQITVPATGVKVLRF
ncbi:MAG: alpha-amylase, partial [Mucilaginibacter polytrichastri]|nr:alpha-amylase [Mucilaginibacter polytrichastri]